MQHFRALTSGKPVVMGRKTWLSLSLRPLPGRTNIVVTRDSNFTAPGALAAPSLQAALESACGDAMRRGGAAIMIIGGAEIYAQAMPLAHRLEVTQVHARPDGDTYFPAIDPAVWREAARSAAPAAPDDDASFDFVSYIRANAVDSDS
jgi:dihydrofolate reductase